MILDSALTQLQQLSDLAVFHAFCDLRNDRLLLSGQRDLPLRVGHCGWQALNQSPKNVPLLMTASPHLALTHAANAFTKVAIRFVAVTYTDRARPKSLNGIVTIVFIQ
jgi:hypothetical protein